MPAKRRTPKVRLPEYSSLHRTHLQLGDCLLAGPAKGCACGLRDPVSGALREHLARNMWRQHRKDVVADWKHPFPTFAEIVLGGKPLPSVDPAWDELNRDAITYAIIADEVEAWQDTREEAP